MKNHKSCFRIFLEKLINVIIIVTNGIKMVTILKTGYIKIMQLFYKDKSLSLHLREIARQTKLHGPSTTRFLDSLEKDGILKSQRDGNLKKYSLIKNKQAYLIFEMYDIERFEHLTNLRKSAIGYYLEKLPEKPVFAIIFGSTAKGTSRENSDIDLLIITNNKIDTKLAEKEADALTSIKISTFQMVYKEFLTELKLKEDMVIQSAINTGFPIINNICYYEDLYNERI